MLEPATHAEYLARIGFPRILSLYEVQAGTSDDAGGADYTTKELMAAFVAGDIKDDETVSVGASCRCAAPASCSPTSPMRRT